MSQATPTAVLDPEAPVASPAKPVAGPAVSLNTQATVLFDGDCAFCQKSVAILKSLDWRKKLAFQSARDMSALPAHSVELNQQKMLEEMHVLTPAGDRSYAGFRAFRYIAGRLPLLWPALPFLYIPGVPFIGQKVYLWVARNRFQLVPCHDGQCAVPPRRRPQ